RLMIGRCLEAKSAFGVVLIRSGQEVGEPAEPHPFGTTAQIVQAQQLPDGRYRLLCRGEQRFRIERVIETRPYVVGEVTYLGDDAGSVTNELLDEMRALWKEYVELLLKAHRREAGEQTEPFKLA